MDEMAAVMKILLAAKVVQLLLGVAVKASRDLATLLPGKELLFAKYFCRPILK
jgi:hypothetical protein